MSDLNSKDWLKIINSFLRIAFVFTVVFFIQSSDKRLSWAYFVSSITSLPSYGEMGDWTPPPIPVLLSPANNSYRNTLGMIMDWTDVVDDMSNPVYYIYQSSHNTLFFPLTFESGHLSASQIPAPGTPDGVYYWRVRACDSDNNCSAWTDPWVVTVDNIAPTKPSWVRPANNSFTRQSQNMLFDWTDSTDVNLDGYEYENTKAGGSTWKSVDTCGLIIQSQFPNTQVGPGGTCINAPAASLSTDGIYTRRVRAKDKAGNYSSWSDEWTITRDTVQPSSYVDSFSVPATPLTTFNVGVTAVDLSSGVKSIELFYRKDGGSWTSNGAFTSSPISFTSSGDGLYEFYSIAEDMSDDLTSADMADGTSGDNNTGNIESKSPLVEASIIVDTVKPLDVSLSITGSFTKSVAEKITTNGSFDTGDLTGWTTAGDVTITGAENITQPSTLTPLSITPYDEGNSMARIGNYSYSDDEGNMVWENRLMRSFEGGAKSISLYYNFVSRDDDFDDPGFFIRLNGQEVFKLSSSSLPSGDPNEAKSSDWQQFYYDLSTYSNDSNVNLALYSGNMNDSYRQSWTYIDKVTTYFVSAPAHAVYTLTGSDPGGSGINHFEYSIDGSPFISGDTFGNTDSLSVGGTHIVQYLSIDNAGNNSSVSTVKIITDDKKPSPISDLSITSKTTNSITLSWNAPYNDYDNPSSEKASLYDVRYSLNPIDEANFNSATKVDNVPSPKEHNFLPISDPDYNSYQESLTITGLSPNTDYYFAIKSSDQAPNPSDISKVVHDATYSLTPLSTVSAGDIVINEIMWMGTASSPSDQYIELHNTTNQPIALSGFRINKLDGGSLVNTGIGLTNITIPTKGYLVITKFDPASSESHLINTLSSSTNVLIDSNVNLLDLSDPLNPRMQIELEGPAGEIVDVAWESMTALTEGLNEGGKYYSMERTSIPGDGTKPLNWYTCIDEASKSDFFDNVADERGTPGAENRSENEPPPLTEPSTEPSPKLSPEPSIEPSIEPPSITPTETPILESSPTPEITSVPENTPIPEADPTVSDSPTPTP